jgi:predicted amidophosphoribosyltransferase
MSFETAISKSLNLLFPSDIYCAACGNLIDGTRPYALCDVCVREIPWHTGDTCFICGKALASHRTGGICYECRECDRSFDAGISCCSYAGPARDLVRAMKYKDSAWIAEKLADAMYDRWAQISLCPDETFPDERTPSTPHLTTYPSRNPARPFSVVPVPMAETKKRARGYDQA